ncbi:putative HVA22-like protein g [Impatiens glandulifera]|uniref:putative HVA22-like protein g n=1 Tax=Impatiens glandulifera TaxID=253017 RepID=UPI001FB0EB4B|nr:putative HVA22-like protein g [Impatiens glandulifera]
MIGSFLTRGLGMVFGYAYPAYECFKCVEKNKPDIMELRFWCQYWILVAVLTVSERIGDTFISWVPMYSEAKLAFFIYLWYPKTKGTTYVYDSFFKPYVAKHETEIDRNLLELRTRAGDVAVVYWQKAANYGQTRVFEILHYFSAQSSTPRQQTTQQQTTSTGQKPGPKVRQQEPKDNPPSPTSSRTSSSSSHHKEEDVSVDKLIPSQVARTSSLPGSLNVLKKTLVDNSKPPRKGEESEAMQIELVASSSSSSSTSTSANEKMDKPIGQEMVDNSIRGMRSRLRKTRSST